MEEEIEKNIHKTNEFLRNRTIEISIDFKKENSRSAKKNIRNNVKLRMKGVYIISLNANHKNAIYVGQSAKCIQNRLLKHVSAVYGKTEANLTYRNFFEKYNDKEVIISIIPTENKFRISNEEVELLLRIKEVMLTNELKPAFVFLRIKS
jgi:hypothetical protein